MQFELCAFNENHIDPEEKSHCLSIRDITSQQKIFSKLYVLRFYFIEMKSVVYISTRCCEDLEKMGIIMFVVFVLVHVVQDTDIQTFVKSLTYKILLSVKI